MEDAAPGEDRILTIPNVISVVRLLCVPVFLWLLFDQENRVAAAGLLAILGATDWVDGYIARHYDQVSNLGKILDPVADRVLLIVGVIMMLVIAACGAARIDVTWYGKAGTFAVMFAFPLFLWASAGDDTVNDLAYVAAWGFAIPGLILGYIALAQYVPLGLRALRDGRAARAEFPEVPA